MKKIITATVMMIVTSCAQSQNNDNYIKGGEKSKAGIKEAVATFGEGCFWHSEIVFQSLTGVRDAVSGYAGGEDPHPTYDRVCTGATGHAEVVQVYYDPDKISFETLVKAFFASQDPTTLNRQGNDEGTQYRSISFYRNENEKQVIEREIKRLTELKKYQSKIVTEVLPFKIFSPAENYHQEYISQHPDNNYVRNVSIPEFLEWKKSFKADYK